MQQVVYISEEHRPRFVLLYVTSYLFKTCCLHAEQNLAVPWICHTGHTEVLKALSVQRTKTHRITVLKQMLHFLTRDCTVRSLCLTHTRSVVYIPYFDVGFVADKFTYYTI